jgi:hypothetical protein
VFQLAEPGAARRYHGDAIALGVNEALAQPAVEVFAFQEMDRTSGAPQNDRPIFSSVTSLMKAQAYELGALPLRKKAPSIYQFNLLSVVDAELARLMFKGSKIACTEVESEHYLARYIIRKKETFSRIRFIRSSALAKALPDYGRLHEANAQLFDKACNTFYEGIVKDRRRNKILLDDFKKEVKWRLIWTVKKALKITVQIEEYWLHWSDKSDRLEIQVNLEQAVVDLLNSDPEFKKHVAKTLASVYRYDGPFMFEVDDIPF